MKFLFDLVVKNDIMVLLISFMFTYMVSKDISGDIRHPVDYLVELIETKVATEWRHLKA